MEANTADEEMCVHLVQKKERVRLLEGEHRVLNHMKTGTNRDEFTWRHSVEVVSGSNIFKVLHKTIHEDDRVYCIILREISLLRLISLSL